MKRTFTALLLTASAFGITACSSLPEVITGTHHYPGYKSYDPCIRCGESWIVVPNQPMAAIRQSRQTPGFTDADYERARQKMNEKR